MWYIRHGCAGVVVMVMRAALLAGALGLLFGPGCVLPESSLASGCIKYICDDETVTDSATGLTWQRNLPATYAGCTGRLPLSRGMVGSGCTWDEAKAYCGQLMLEGSGWRLPTKDELLSIVDTQSSHPSIDVVAFPNTPSYGFWSSSPDAGSSGGAWHVQFSGGGSVSLDTGVASRVRCVR